MFQRLLIPLDGSPGAEHAIPVAASLARQAHGSLVLLHIVKTTSARKSTIAQAPKASYADSGLDDREGEGSQVEAIERAVTDAANYLAMIPTRYAEDLAGLSTEMDITFGSASPTLPSTARLEHVDLIVLCRHQETGLGQWGLESLTQQIMRHSPVPLLILNEHEKETLALDGTRPLRILVPLDGSLFAESVLAPTLHLLAQCAAVKQRELCLMHVVDLFAGDGTGDEETHMSPYTTGQARQNALRYLQAVAKRLYTMSEGGPNIQITCLMTSGVDIASAILNLRELETVSEPDAFSLIALATHGREGMNLRALGSVADHLLNATALPLLTVCPKETTARLINFALPIESRN